MPHVKRADPPAKRPRSGLRLPGPVGLRGCLLLVLLFATSLWDCGGRQRLNDCSISDPCDNGYQCVFGRCKCNAPSLLCQNQCTDIQSDANNCGGCGVACGVGQSCLQGACSGAACPAGQTQCQGICIDTSVSPQHCGSCGNACLTTQICVGGVCTGAVTEPPPSERPILPDGGPPEQGPIDTPPTEGNPDGGEGQSESPPEPPPSEQPPTDRTPSVLWARVPETIYVQQGHGITTDAAGNVYVTGWMTGQPTFGTTTLKTNGARDIFVAKLDKDGNWLWAKNAGSVGNDEGYSIAVDSRGDIYVTGLFRAKLTHGNITLTARAADVVILKFDSTGKPIGARQAGSVGDDEGYCITVDAKDDVFVVGAFRGTATFGSLSVKSNGARDAFVAKINGANGDWVWVKQAGSSRNDVAHSAATDAAGNVFVTGFHFDNATFGGTQLKSQGAEDTFVAKLDANGTWLWAKTAGDNNADIAHGIAVDSSGDAVLVGEFRRDMKLGSLSLKAADDIDGFVAKIDSSGNWKWARQVSSDDHAVAYDVAIDGLGNAVVTGYFEKTGTFGGVSVQSKGLRDIFVAKITGSGTWLWARRAGGISQDLGHSVAVDSSGNAYLTGYFQNSADFGSLTLQPKAGIAAFLWKVGP